LSSFVKEPIEYRVKKKKKETKKGSQEPEVGARFIEPARKVAKKQGSDKSDPYSKLTLYAESLKF